MPKVLIKINFPILMGGGGGGVYKERLLFHFSAKTSSWNTPLFCICEINFKLERGIYLREALFFLIFLFFKEAWGCLL